MTEIKKTKILNYINVFRGLAILLIVAGHTMQFGEMGSLTERISFEIFCGGTALFIFISGRAGSALQHRLFSGCGERGLLSGCVSQASHCL